MLHAEGRSDPRRLVDEVDMNASSHAVCNVDGSQDNCFDVWLMKTMSTSSAMATPVPRASLLVAGASPAYPLAHCARSKH